MRQAIHSTRSLSIWLLPLTSVPCIMFSFSNFIFGGFISQSHGGVMSL